MYLMDTEVRIRIKIVILTKTITKPHASPYQVKSFVSADSLGSRHELSSPNRTYPWLFLAFEWEPNGDGFRSPEIRSLVYLHSYTVFEMAGSMEMCKKIVADFMQMPESSRETRDAFTN